MNRFWQAFTNLFRIEDLRNRLFFTLALLGVYRLGAHIPTPGINTSLMEDIFKQAASSSMLGIFDLFSGGTFRRMTIFALGIMPYITASIILQLMQVVFPYLERLQKEGELGRRKITQYTRYLTIALSVIQSSTIATTLQAQTYSGQSLGRSSGFGILVDDRADAYDRFGVHYVAGRADQRARHWQRHVADHFRRHCCGVAARHL